MTPELTRFTKCKSKYARLPRLQADDGHGHGFNLPLPGNLAVIT